MVGIKGPTGILRAESGALSDAVADRQLAEVGKHLGSSPQGVIQLPWLSVAASDVLYARTNDVAGSEPKARAKARAGNDRAPSAARQRRPRARP